MAHKTLINGTAYEISGGRTLVNGTGYAIGKGKTLVSGTAYEVGFGTAIGSLPLGTTLSFNVNGVTKNWLIVHQGLPSSAYDSSCNGTWLLLDDIYTKKAWDSSDNNYANSDIHSYLNNDFLNLLDSNLKSVIKQVKIPYTNGTGTGGTVSTGSNGLSTKVFLLSYAEMDFSGSSYANVEGAVLDYFKGAADSVRIEKYNGSAIYWYLRSPVNTDTSKVWFVAPNGTAGNGGRGSSRGIRPAIILPSDYEI